MGLNHGDAEGQSVTRNHKETTPLLSRADIEAAPPSNATAASERSAGPHAAASRLTGAEGASITSRVVSGLTVASAYICVSAAMIHFNKHLMHETRFPFPTFLTTLHMLGSVVLSLLLRQAVPSLFPSWAFVFGRRKAEGKSEDFPGANVDTVTTSGMAGIRDLFDAFLPFFPLGVCGMVSLVAGNCAYRYSAVTFLQMIKESHIVFVYVLMVFFGLEVPRWRSILTLACVAVSAAFAVCGADEASFSLRGLLLQLLAGLAGSTQIVLSNRMMVKSGGPKIDPLMMVFCTAPAMLLALLPANAIFWDARIPERLHEFGHQLMANVLLAFVLQVVMAVTIRNLSGTGHALASVTKDLFIVFSATWLLHEHLAWLQVAGFVGSVLGIAWYSAMKLFPSLRGE